MSELTAQCGTSREAVADSIRDLCTAGYSICSHPHLGIRLESSPDRLIADDLAGRIGDCPLIREILVFEETSSTNDRALHLGQKGAAGGLVIFAERQNAGRGRLGRVWDSEARKGLWFSLLIRPDFPVGEWTRLTTWAAVAVAHGIESLVGCRAAVKWPNDILIQGKKVVGILIETLVLSPLERSLAVVGIGVNVNQERDEFPPELRERAGSLAQFHGSPVDRSDLAAAILRELDTLYRVACQDFAAILREANERSHLNGRYVAVDVGGKQVKGIAEGLDKRGGLLLRMETGGIETITGGEVTVVSYGE